MKVIAITGGGAGIGRGIAWHFARAGYAVSITDSDRQAGRESLQVMREAGTEAIFVAGDVSKPADMNRWLSQTRAKLGCPDVLVNNAGTEIRKDVLALSIAEFDSVIATNLRGTFICSQAAAKMMVKSRPSKSKERGVIINIASTRAFMSEAGTEGYTASKGGIIALTHGMAVSLARHHIRVNCISAPAGSKPPTGRRPARRRRRIIPKPTGSSTRRAGSACPKMSPKPAGSSPKMRAS
jgi:NAD(P)-dependent dehydrogenase (short-subunit alcohol dehydrogenase family)